MKFQSKAFVGFLIATLMFSTAMSAEAQLKNRPLGRPIQRQKQSQVVDGTKLQQKIDSAKQNLAKASRLIEQAKPAYSGRRQRAMFAVKCAADNLNDLQNFRKSAPTGGRQPKIRRPSMRERMKDMPEVRERPRREFSKADLANSDQILNTAGLALLEARESLSGVPDQSDGLLTQTLQFMDSAISDIERSIGRIRQPITPRKR